MKHIKDAYAVCGMKLTDSLLPTVCTTPGFTIHCVFLQGRLTLFLALASL